MLGTVKLTRKPDLFRPTKYTSNTDTLTTRLML